MNEAAEGGGFRPTPHLILTEDELRRVVRDLLTQQNFVIDVETTFGSAHNNEVLWVGLGARGRVYLIPINHPLGYVAVPEHYAMELPPEDQRKLLPSGKVSMAKKRVRKPTTYTPKLQQLAPGVVFDILEPLLFSDRGKVGQNTKFDLMSVAKYYGGRIPPGPYHDTIVITHLLNENRMQYGLKEVICDWLGIPSAQRAAFYPNLGRSGVEKEAVDVVARYLAKDVRYTWLYWQHQHPRLAKQGLQRAYDLEMELYGVLMRMESHGFPIDTGQLATTGARLVEEIRGIEGEAWSIAGYQFELTNPLIKRDLLFKPKKEGGQGLKPLSVTKKTQTPSLTKAVLEVYAERGNRLAQLFLEFSKMEKLRGTFIDGINEHMHNGRIHTSFKQHGTVTGRLSASRPNLQQIPARGDGAIIRELFVAEPGHVLVVADYDQIELRCAAYLSDDTNMKDVFSTGQDIHRAAAAAMYQVEMEEVTKDQRQAGKGQNFLTLYGGTAPKLARTAGVEVDVAEEFIRRYYVQFPHLKAWKAQLIKDAKGRGVSSNPHRQPPYVLIPPFDRRRRIVDLYSPDAYDRWRGERQAINAVVQGFASYVMKLALIDLDKALPQGSKMLVTVHDEIVVDCHPDLVDDVKNVLESTMGSVSLDGQPILGSVPLVASAGVGRSWVEAKA